MRTIAIHLWTAMSMLLPTLAFAEFEQTTDTKVTDDLFQGGYSSFELDQTKSMSKEQKAIMDKFMNGRYSSAIDGSSRYSGILEYHDNNFDGVTEHDGAGNAAESSGDKVGLGKTGLNGIARQKAMIVERINSSGNCELTKSDQDALKDNNFGAVQGAVKGKSFSESDIANEVLGSAWNGKFIKDTRTGTLRVDRTLTGDRLTEANKMFALFQKQKTKLKYFQEDSTNSSGPIKYRMRCPNVSAIVLDKGSAHGADIGEMHRVYDLNQKTFTAGTGEKGPLVGATGEAVNVAKQYSTAVTGDSGRTAIGTDIVSAMKARGMDVWTENDGKTVVTRMPDGSLKRDQVQASVDDLKSEFAWLEAQKKNRLNETWKTLRAERFIAGDQYDSANVSSEIGSLLAQNASKTPAERDQIVADKVAEHNVYSGDKVCLKVNPNGVGISLGSPQACPAQDKIQPAVSVSAGAKFADVCPAQQPPGTTCFHQASAKELRSPQIAGLVGGGVTANQLTQIALDAAKNASNSNPAAAAEKAKNKARLAARVKDCMGRGKWCEQVDLSSLNNVQNQQELDRALAQNPKLKGRGITLEDAKAGTAYLDVQGDVGNAFKDTREFVSVKMEEAMEGSLDKFAKTVESADFNDFTDSKTDGKFFTQVKRQQAINLKIAQDVLDYSEKAYQECVNRGAAKCERQFTKENFDPSTMNTLQLFGRNPDRDGKTLGLDATQIGGELTRPSMTLSPNDPLLAPRAPAAAAPAALPARGSAPSTRATPFSPN